MSKNVLILSGSPRKNGNSDILCDEFARGAAEAGNNVEKIRVAEKNIGFCRACYACRGTGVCTIKDDMAEVLQKMIDADVLVLASPVYFYSIDAQLRNHTRSINGNVQSPRRGDHRREYGSKGTYW
ncbi:MAG: flavodoxin family protein [Clostridia bacterium]|nr:flavodoxin family protein [Clostridia bacterium]